jgi:flagellar basal-body rod modification protein FlgD
VTTDVKTVDSATLQSLGLASPPKAKPATLGQEEFLKLMMTQLRNQDPFKPLESGEFLSQIAQFSTVTGIQDLQASFKTLSSSLYSNQALQASSLVGRTVLVPSASAALAAGGQVSGAVDLTSSTSQLVVGVYDGTGQLVRRISLGPQAAGQVSFAWDGLTDAGTAAAPGTYRVRAEAEIGGQAVAMDTLVASKVESVVLGGRDGGIRLNLSSLGGFDFSAVRQIM